jgi:tetratricopeptide (TPR) repeat protein
LKVWSFIIAAVVSLPAYADQGSSAQQLYDAAVKLRDQNHLDDAISIFDQAIAADSTTAKAFYARGVTWRWKANYPKALADFKKAAALDPNHTDYQLEVGLVEEYMGQSLIIDSIQKRLRKDYAGALASYKAALQVSKNAKLRDYLQKLHEWYLQAYGTAPPPLAAPPGDFPGPGPTVNCQKPLDNADQSGASHRKDPVLR